MKDELFSKKYFNIKDLALIVKKETQTIRSWENKGIINKPSKRSDNGWREYSKEELASVLENIVNYNWQRKVIKNEDEIKFMIEFLRGRVEYNSITLSGEVNE